MIWSSEYKNHFKNNIIKWWAQGSICEDLSGSIVDKYKHLKKLKISQWYIFILKIF